MSNPRNNDYFLGRDFRKIFYTSRYLLKFLHTLAIVNDHLTQNTTRGVKNLRLKCSTTETKLREQNEKRRKCLRECGKIRKDIERQWERHAYNEGLYNFRVQWLMHRKLSIISF